MQLGASSDVWREIARGPDKTLVCCSWGVWGDCPSSELTVISPENELPQLTLLLRMEDFLFFFFLKDCFSFVMCFKVHVSL